MFCKVLVLMVSVVAMVFGAPRSKSHQSTTYDQKQAGEYNIQLHLKDFQIIALVGDDPFASFGGDYDYQYDYSDFTIKPITPQITTKKPENATAEVPIISSTHKHQPTSTNTQKAPITFTFPTPSTLKPEASESPLLSSSSQSPILSSSSSPPSPTPTSTLKGFFDGQIPVIVHQDFGSLSSALVKDEPAEQKVEALTSVAIVTDDSTDSGRPEHPSQLGDILHYRKCPQGYGKDKRGRCRKVRRPQIPFGISRFASNLAARFRQSAGDKSDSLEDSTMD